MMQNKSLFKRFTIFSFIAFVITGVTLGVLISNHLRNDMLKGLEDMAPGVLDFHLEELNRIITIVMSLGLLVLYLFLMKIVHDASKTLISQNKKLQEQKEELEISYKNTIITLSNAVDARDPYTAGHSERVTRLSLDIGRTLGLDKDQLLVLENAALFHDVGKIGIPDNILLKPGKLTDEEFDIIKKHSVIGVNILINIEYLKPSLPLIYHHHERYEGKGYPDGLAGAVVPLGSRIIAVADTYDAILSDRPYRKGMSHEAAISEIIKNKGIQFDPHVVDAFLEIIN